MPNISLLFTLNNLQHNFIFLIQVKIFEVSLKSKYDPFLVDAKIRNFINMVNFRQIKFPRLWQYSFDSNRYVDIKCFRKIFIISLFYS